MEGRNGSLAYNFFSSHYWKNIKKAHVGKIYDCIPWNLSKGKMTRSQTVHKVFCVSFGITGSLTKFMLILIVIYRGLIRQSRFAFWFAISWWVLCDYLYVDSLCFLPESAKESTTFCRPQGYVIFSIEGTQLFSITLLCESLHLWSKKYIVWPGVFHQKYHYNDVRGWLMCRSPVSITRRITLG